MIKNNRFLSVSVIVCLLIGVWHFGSATWIYSKAHAATFLINDAWQKTLVNKGVNKPWSWADTWPVAEMTVPKIGLKEIILSGDSGAVLAFGPGLSNGGATLDSDKVKLISAHRDTHFRELKHITVDDQIYVKTASGNKQYKVTDVKVVDSRTFTINAASDVYDLVLATCYPFNSITAGGYERFVVYSKEINKRKLYSSRNRI